MFHKYIIFILLVTVVVVGQNCGILESKKQNNNLNSQTSENQELTTAAFGASRRGPIVQASDPNIVTHTMRAGEIELGVSNLGGGYVNYFNVGDGNVVSANYGRGWQGSVRDLYHGSRYNPTQAGFNDFSGAPVTVHANRNSISIPPFQMPLYSDPVFDFTENEDLVADSTRYNDNNNSDEDGVPNETSQDSEIRSEFDFVGVYKDASPLVESFNVSAVKHFSQNTYARRPRAILQFGSNAKREDGTAVLDRAHRSRDIASVLPGAQAASPRDLSKVVFTSYGIRILTTSGYTHPLWFNRNSWQRIELPSIAGRGGELRFQINQSSTEARDERYEYLENRLLILSQSDRSNLNSAKAVGVYVPDTNINKFQTIGRNMASDMEIEYKEDRRYQSAIMFTHVNDEQVGIRVRLWTEGLLYPNKYHNNVAEALRQEVYILYGSPENILSAVQSGRLN